MTWWIVGGLVVVVVLVLFALARWLWLFSDPRGLVELRDLDPGSVRERLERIFEANRELGPALRVEVRPGLLMFLSPAWRWSKGDLVEQFLTVLPERFHALYYAPSSAPDDDEWEALADAARGMRSASKSTLQALSVLLEFYEGDLAHAPTVPGTLDYVTGDRPLSLLLVDFFRCRSAGATAAEFRARWCDLEGSPPGLFAKLDALELMETEDLVAVMAGADQPLSPGEAPEFNAMFQTEGVRARFFTPGRAARHAALIEGISAQTDTQVDDIEAPPSLQVEVPGLPSPIDFVMDLGQHVTPLTSREMGGQTLSMNALRALALSNASAFGPQPELPVDGISIVIDESDHGATKVLMVPEMLADEGRVWAVAPAHACLILFDRNDPAQVDDARATFDELFPIGGEDAPLPEPIEVTPAGFARSSWP